MQHAAHLADHALPRVALRQCALFAPKHLRYHLQHDREALNSALRIFLDAVRQHHRDSLSPSNKARVGTVAFIHQFFPR